MTAMMYGCYWQRYVWPLCICGSLFAMQRAVHDVWSPAWWPCLLRRRAEYVQWDGTGRPAPKEENRGPNFSHSLELVGQKHSGVDPDPCVGVWTQDFLHQFSHDFTASWRQSRACAASLHGITFVPTGPGPLARLYTNLC